MTTSNMTISQKDKTDLADALMEILRENSGGIKMTALIPELFQRFNGWRSFDVAAIIENGDLERIIEEHPNLMLVEYDWDMSGDKNAPAGTGPIRVKQFVCTKF